MKIERPIQKLPDATLGGLSELLADRMGLDFPRERWSDLERGLLAAAQEFGAPDLESCAQRLLDGPLTHREIEILASHLTVGETYFFRDRASFEALEQSILPALIESRRHSGRFLRIWSAGCCTGEEPYSIAMLLDRLLPADEQWHITLLATDINPKFLRRAQTGIYGEWSFRGTPAWLRDRYFTKRVRGGFELHPRIRKMVTFSHLNLVEDVYPSLTCNTNAMDLIFCRNVLMYFTEPNMQQVIGKLHRALVDGGRLSVGPSEMSSRTYAAFLPAHFGDAIFYRKASGDTLQAERTESPDNASFDPFPVLSDPLQESWPLQEKASAVTSPEAGHGHAPEEIPEAEAVVSAAGAEPEAGNGATRLYEEAKRCANQGRLAEAAELCEQAVVDGKLDPKNHYLLATIRQEMGHNEAAEVSLRRALYLDPGFALAHFAFANLRLSQGQYEESERYLRNALTALQRLESTDVAIESDGLLASRLCEIITAALDSLPRSGEPGGREGMGYRKMGLGHA